ncbi:hypothetical protein RvY_07451 [Ramazzottius varieornatus]|uniref:Uncharacterized protein n=1 Tax=Ramazzottius varieornatus TaxID=947166 RepID=A0A1D1V799_RAMVA|nr:hypothetical protein RvY_07451 [Ramazzottius varieornatus]
MLVVTYKAAQSGQWVGISKHEKLKVGRSALSTTSIRTAFEVSCTVVVVVAVVSGSVAVHEVLPVGTIASFVVGSPHNDVGVTRVTADWVCAVRKACCSDRTTLLWIRAHVVVVALGCSISGSSTWTDACSLSVAKREQECHCDRENGQV